MGRVPILLTQGPYRGRALRDLANEELDHAGATCPRWNPQFADSARQVRAEVQRRVIAQRRRASEASRRTQQEATAAREAQREAEVASVVASMTPDERARYDAADAARRRRLLAAVRARLANEARRAEHARQEAARATWTVAYRAAHPTRTPGRRRRPATTGLAVGRRRPAPGSSPTRSRRSR
jgi:colicin import membrane protein